MAWQTPKTNWSAADGVRAADFNRIEENIRLLRDGGAIYSDITLYVSNAGNDASGAGTSASPYATIGKALSMLPKDFNGATASINIAAGTYNEEVVIRGFSGGMLLITGAANSDIVVSKLTIDNSYVRTSNVNIITTGVVIGGGAQVIATGDVIASGRSTGVDVFDNSHAMFSKVEVANVNTGVAVYNNARVFVFQLDVLNTGTAMTASNGGIIAYAGFSGTASTAVSATSSGGRVYTGSASLAPGGGAVM